MAGRRLTQRQRERIGHSQERRRQRVSQEPAASDGAGLGPEQIGRVITNHGRTAIVEAGGSIRDQQVIDTCNKYGIAMAFCGLRLFHH